MQILRSHFSIALLLVLILGVTLSIQFGVQHFSPNEIWDALLKDTSVSVSESERYVITHLRLPRTVISLLSGAGLALSGLIMQAVFRNSLADPGITGISAGAMAAVSFVVVSGLSIGTYVATLQIAAFAGASASLLLLLFLAGTRGSTDSSRFILAGIAINAAAAAVTGILIFSSEDVQLRSIIFWSMGSCAGLGWNEALTLSGTVLACTAALWMRIKEVDVLQLGNQFAELRGVPVKSLTWVVLTASTLLVGSIVAFTGLIGFIGLVAPHIVGGVLTGSPTSKKLVPTFLCGGVLLVYADLLSRLIAPPSEVPVGTLTACIGGPFFLYLLYRGKQYAR